MTTGYEKTSPSPFAASGIFDDVEFNTELNLVATAFDATAGHDHDGASGKGPNVALSAFSGWDSLSSGYLASSSDGLMLVSRTLESTNLTITNTTGGGNPVISFPSLVTANSYTNVTITIASSGLISSISSGIDIPVGLVMPMFQQTAPSGWVRLNGKTIGNGSSNATERANADTASLFAHLWDNLSNTLVPIFDSAGVASTRGANAAADYAANKAISLPDARGRAFFGIDTMGNSDAGRLTSNATSTINTGGGDTPGSWGTTGATQTTSISLTQLAGHAHTLTSGGSAPTLVGFGSDISDIIRNTPGTDDVGTDSIGGSAAHTNMPPFTLIGWMIKL